MHMLRLLQQFEVNRLRSYTVGEEATVGCNKVELTELLRRSDAVLVHAPRYQDPSYVGAAQSALT